MGISKFKKLNASLKAEPSKENPDYDKLKALVCMYADELGGLKGNKTVTKQQNHYQSSTAKKRYETIAHYYKRGLDTISSIEQ